MNTGNIKERRSLDRSDIFMVVEFRPEGEGGRTFLGITSNISTAGLSFESPDFDLNESEELELRLKQPESGLCVNVSGELVWRNRTDMFKSLNGVKLLNVDGTVEKSILDIMSAAKAYADVSFVEAVPEETGGAPCGPVPDGYPQDEESKNKEAWTDGKQVLHERLSYAKRKSNALTRITFIMAAAAVLSVLYSIAGFNDLRTSSLMDTITPYLNENEKEPTAPDNPGFKPGYPPLMKLIGSAKRNVFEEGSGSSGGPSDEGSKRFAAKVFSGQDMNIENKRRSGGSGGSGSGGLTQRKPRPDRSGKTMKVSREMNNAGKNAVQQPLSAEKKTAADSTAAKPSSEPETDVPRYEGLIVTAGATEPDTVSAKGGKAPPERTLPTVLKDIKVPGNFPPIRFALVVTDKDIPDSTAEPGAILPGQQIIFNDTFDSNRNKWALANTNALSVVLGNGLYNIENRNDKTAYLIFNKREIAYGPEYVIDVSMEASGGTGKYSYGLVWGSREPLEYYVFRLTDMGGYYIEKSYEGRRRILSSGGPEDAAVNKSGMNNLRVAARGGSTNFYINGRYIEGLPDIRSTGGRAGFIIDGKAAVAVDRISISGKPNDKNTGP